MTGAMTQKQAQGGQEQIDNAPPKVLIGGGGPPSWVSHGKDERGEVVARGGGSPR